MATIGVHMALYRMLSELLESHTSRPHSNFPGPMAPRGLSRRPGFLAESAAWCCCRGVSVAFGLLSTPKKRKRSVTGKEGSCEAVRLFLALPCLAFLVSPHFHRCCDRFAEPVKTEAVGAYRSFALALSVGLSVCLSVCPFSTLVLVPRVFHPEPPTGLYTCYTPIPRADQLQPHSFALLDRTRKNSSLQQ